MQSLTYFKPKLIMIIRLCYLLNRSVRIRSCKNVNNTSAMRLLRCNIRACWASCAIDCRWEQRQCSGIQRPKVHIVYTADN